MSEQGLQAIKQRTDNYAYGVRDIHITERYASRAIEDVWKLVAEVERLREALENAQSEIIPIRGYERKDIDGITSVCIKIRKVLDGEEWE